MEYTEPDPGALVGVEGSDLPGVRVDVSDLDDLDGLDFFLFFLLFFFLRLSTSSYTQKYILR